MNLTIENTLPKFNEKELPLEKAFLLTEAAIHKKLNVILIFTSLDQMFNLNNQLRNKSQPTDVLSLPSDHNAGEVFICPEYIYKQKYNSDRIVHLWIHGLLHLAGYTHEHNDDFEIMSQHEISLCQKLNLIHPYLDRH